MFILVCSIDFAIGLGTGSRTDYRMDLKMVKYDRRYLDRLEIPGAKVEYTCENGRTANTGLINLTKISVRFYINHKLKIDELVDLSIQVKDKEIINVKGNVIWTQSAKDNEFKKANAVIQFLPFGTDDRYNTLQSYELLAQLEEEYIQDFKILNNIYVS